MEVTLALKSWKVVQDEKTKQPKVAGAYGIMMGEKEIASQAFNGGYAEKEIHFSPELTTKLRTLEDEIKAELTKLIS